MNDTKILDIFYKRVVPEAANGKVDCFLTVNMVFDLVIENKEISKCNNLPYEGIFIPTLRVSDKELFDELLVEYVHKAISFYSPSNFYFLDDLDCMNIPNLEEVKEEYLIKYVICTLFANASVNDFDNPINFLRTRLAMFDNKILIADGVIDFGYLETIGANLYLEEEVSSIKTETPYRIVGCLEFDDGYRLMLPKIYAGKTADKYRIYGIQKTTVSDPIQERRYLKNIRKGMIAKIKGAPEHYFLAVMLFLSLCSDKDIEVIPYLIERWNAKRIAMLNKAKRNMDITILDIDREQDKIQSNITDIFIRYFTKLEDVTDGMEIQGFPFELDSNMHIKMGEDINSRSSMFNEIFAMSKDKRKQNNSNLGR